MDGQNVRAGKGSGCILKKALELKFKEMQAQIVKDASVFS